MLVVRAKCQGHMPLVPIGFKGIALFLTSPTSNTNKPTNPIICNYPRTLDSTMSGNTSIFKTFLPSSFKRSKPSPSTQPGDDGTWVAISTSIWNVMA